MEQSQFLNEIHRGECCSELYWNSGEKQLFQGFLKMKFNFSIFFVVSSELGQETSSEFLTIQDFNPYLEYTNPGIKFVGFLKASFFSKAVLGNLKIDTWNFDAILKLTDMKRSWFVRSLLVIIPWVQAAVMIYSSSVAVQECFCPSELW